MLTRLNAIEGLGLFKSIAVIAAGVNRTIIGPADLGNLIILTSAAPLTATSCVASDLNKLDKASADGGLSNDAATVSGTIELSSSKAI